MIGSSSAEKRHVKTTYSGLLMWTSFSETRKSSISFERTFLNRRASNLAANAEDCNFPVLDRIERLHLRWLIFCKMQLADTCL